jgi:Tfp pilus assembly protein PilF
MRAALPLPAPSPAVPAPVALRPRGARGELALALFLALVPLALQARVLFYPALEVGDGETLACTGAGQAWRGHGLGGLTLYLEGLRASSSVLPCFSRCVSLGLHAGATLLAFALARRLGAGRGASAFGALLFAVHPLRLEAVAWLSERGVLLGGFFFLLGLLAALGERGELAAPSRWAGSRAAFLLALLADPRLVLGLVGLLWVERRTLARRPAHARALADLALFFVAGACLVWSPVNELAPDAPGFLARLAHAPLALAALGGLWCVPLGLTPHHPHPALSSSPVAPWALGASWLALALVCLALWRVQRRLPRIALAGLAFVLLGLPQVCLASGTTLFQESSAYVPALGLELLLALALQAVPARGTRPALALGGLVLVACAFRTAARLPDWRSEPALQASALALRPEPRAHDALGRWHLLHGRLSQAQRAHERALELWPQDARARLYLGALELRRALIPGQEAHLARAREQLETGLAAVPDWGRANELLGEVYQRAEEDERAQARLEAAAARAPSGQVLTRLGMVRRRRLDQDGARAAFTRATEVEPGSSDAWCGLGLVQLQADEPDAARVSLERALALEPDQVEARTTLARLQELGGEHAEAERNLRRALGVNPSNVDALYALGTMLSGADRADEALRYLDHACELPRSQPHVRAHLESARLRMARGEVEVPRARLRAVLAFNPEQAEARALLERLGASGAGGSGR